MLKHQLAVLLLDQIIDYSTPVSEIRKELKKKFKKDFQNQDYWDSDISYRLEEIHLDNLFEVKQETELIYPDDHFEGF